MSASAYSRRILIGFALLAMLVIVSPHAIIGGVHFLCDQRGGEGCGDVGILFIIFGVMPALIVILGFIAWTAFKRLRALKFSMGYILLTCLLLAGCFQSILFAGPAAEAGPLRWETITPPLLATMILAALCGVPKASERGVPKPILQNVFVIVSIVLLLRLADAILYPLWLFPGGLQLSFALQRLAYLGPLKRIPDALFIVAFAALLLMTLKQWRDPDRVVSDI